MEKNMGIIDLFKISHGGKNLSDLAITLSPSDFKGKIICIDASWQIYNAKHAAAKMGNGLFNEDGQFLYIIVSIIKKYHDLKTNQVWVFDNPAPNPIKAKENQLRKEKKTETTYRLNSKDIMLLKEFLDILGIHYVTAPSGVEAEHYAAVLCKLGKAFAVISGDSDVLPFGGNLLRLEKRKGKNIYKLYKLSTILSTYQIGWIGFIEICVSLGSDFAEKTYGIGPKTVIQKYQKGQLILTTEQKKARDYFASVIEVKESGFNFIKKKKKVDLQEYLERYDLLFAEDFTAKMNVILKN